MNKEDIVRALSKQIGFTQKELTEVLDAFFQLVIESTAAGEKVRIKSFGVFETVDKAERVGQNVKRQQTVIIPPKKVPIFKPGKTYKKIVKGG